MPRCRRLARDRLSVEGAEWIARAREAPAVQDLLRRVEQGGVLSFGGVSAGAQAFLSVLLRRCFPQRPLVVVTTGRKIQEMVQQDVETWLRFAGSSLLPQNPSNDAPRSRERVFAQTPPEPGNSQRESAPSTLFYPAWESLPHEGKLPHVDVIGDRLTALVSLLGHGSPAGETAPLIVTAVSALLQRTFSPADLRERVRTLRKGDRMEPLDLVEWLEAQGYEPEAKVTQPGEISLRGGILDVFPPNSRWPARLEFFGDELDSLRYFDPLTQISQNALDSLVLPPGGELGLLRRQLMARAGGGQGKSRMENGGWHEPQENAQSAPLTPSLSPSAGEREEKNISNPANSGICRVALCSAMAGSVKNDVIAKPVEELDSPHHHGLGTFLDYLPPDTIFIFSEPDLLEEQAGLYCAQVPENDPFFISWDEIQAKIISSGMTWLNVSEAVDTGEDLGFASLETFRPLGNRAPEPQIAEAQRQEFFAQMHRWLRQGCDVQVFCNNEGEQQRFREIWKEYGFPLDQSASPTESVAPGQELQWAIGTLSRGFLFEQGRLVVVTDAEIFGRYRVQSPRRLKSPQARSMRSALEIDFSELEEGDYVVHLQHGIGRFRGLQVMALDTTRKRGQDVNLADQAGQECLVIEYAPSTPDQAPPKLYVPVTEAHLVSKYVGAGKARPPLNTLGGARWAKAKAQAEHAVRDLAAELLSIQAARASQTGHAFTPDTPWQREFESSFLFEETPGQHQAIGEAKADMEAPKPMDRLICGDVGFGKTEVALRAAFKAVMDGRQVAVLVPTTVLAQQHFNTFRERMADYPIRLELLSRFRSRREQKRAVEDLAKGAVDIVIGTHRLLQEDVTFKDLGLVIIDEEQRFGVMHKERFKRLRHLVDVLTLSATPIPRTLYLALTGARDMSTIDTPPHDRLPVDTIVIPYDERVIRDAIQREMHRQGQVFFLHNRVATIDAVAAKLQALVPQARIVVGHGQMDSDELEEIMTQFVNGQADVLLSTTIIESGLDIPNANTIFIDRADRFGLSDLYQLRGRVGRYKHQAYAYLLLPRHAGLLTDARQRLSAIKQYSSLGSGFKIAMRDLEIRGAGNLLGPEQSGHITAVGFELYCQLLKQSVSALKGEPVKKRIDVQTRLDFLSFGPLEEREERGKEAVRADSTDGHILVPRETAYYVGDETAEQTPLSLEPAPIKRSPAHIPVSYVRDSPQRIELYRKLAQAADTEDLAAIKNECRDRFGPLPEAVELLLQVAELKILASARAITGLETRGGKLMLQRNQDYLTFSGKFPRLTKKTAAGRLKEIKKLLLAF